MWSRASLVILGILVITLVSCTSGPMVRTNPTSGDLRGMLYDLDRQPLADASVSITLGGKPQSVVTDLHGRFGIGPVPFGPVSLSVVKSGYEPLSWEFRFIEGSQVLYLQMASADQLFERAAAALEKREWQEFQSHWDRASVLSPGTLQGFMLGATSLELRGRAAEAVALLLEYRAERPVFAQEAYLGDLYEEIGDTANALLHWKNALNLKEDAALRTKVGGR